MGIKVFKSTSSYGIKVMAYSYNGTTLYGTGQLFSASMTSFKYAAVTLTDDGFFLLGGPYVIPSTVTSRSFSAFGISACTNKITGEKGIPCGAYWYSYAMSEEDAVKEVEACLAAIRGKQFAYPIYFDFEEQKQIALGRTAVSGIVRAFCETLEKAGYVAGIYSMKSGLENSLTEDVRRAYTNWVAHVGVSKTSYSGHDMWQYSWKGSIPGISGDVDCNYCYRDFPAEIAAAGKNGYTVGAPPEPVAKTVDELAHEVMDGKWGNGEDRRQRLTAAGYDYGAVQAAVNALVKADSVRTHTVRKGDMLSAIAKKYGTTVSAIVAANRAKYPKITADHIVVGWVLAV